MRVLSRFSLGILFSLLLFLDGAFGSLMLGSLLMALKGSIFAGKMGMGGILAMIYAASQNQNHHGTTTHSTSYGTPISLSSLGKKRAVRSVPSSSLTEIMNREIIPDSEIPEIIPLNSTLINLNLNLNSTGVNGTGSEPAGSNETMHLTLSAEKLVSTLNDPDSPVTRRVMRQVAILDQLSCLPKVICGMNTRQPSSKTNIINDYGYLIKFLFDRDSDDDAADDDDDDERADDDEPADDDEDAVFRAESILKKAMAKHKKSPSNKIATTTNPKLRAGSNKNKIKPSKDDEDEDEDEDDDQEDEDDEYSPSRSDVDTNEKIAEMAQDELIEEEPEMLRYVLTEMKNKMRHQKPTPKNPNLKVKPGKPGPNPNSGSFVMDYHLQTTNSNKQPPPPAISSKSSHSHHDGAKPSSSKKPSPTTNTSPSPTSTPAPASTTPIPVKTRQPAPLPPKPAPYRIVKPTNRRNKPRIFTEEDKEAEIKKLKSGKKLKYLMKK